LDYSEGTGWGILIWMIGSVGLAGFLRQGYTKPHWIHFRQRIVRLAHLRYGPTLESTHTLVTPLRLPPLEHTQLCHFAFVPFGFGLCAYGARVPLTFPFGTRVSHTSGSIRFEARVPRFSSWSRLWDSCFPLVPFGSPGWLFSSLGLVILTNCCLAAFGTRDSQVSSSQFFGTRVSRV
jgi:hypothetical protein